jgi:preprotein translocase subunit SecE
MESLIGNIKESYNELVHKVTWPSFSALLSSTRVVLAGSVIIALIIFLMDGLASNVLDVVYSLGA